jgi:ABC-type lipoprotein release transport system permease subunit
VMVAATLALATLASILPARRAAAMRTADLLRTD